MRHELKTVQPHFQHVWCGEKLAEVRKNDRNFEVDDTLWLREFSADDGYGKHYILARVTHVLVGEEWGLKPGYAMLSIRVVEKGTGRPRKEE